MTAIRIAGLALLAVLAGCSTQAGFDQRMSGLVGLSEPELVRTIGVPDSAYTAEGNRRFLQYERLGQRSPAQVQPSFGFGIAGFSFGRGGGVGTGLGFGGPAFIHPPPSCTVTFELVAGRVASFTRRGEACLAVPPD